MSWENVSLRADFLDAEDIVARLHFLEQMEARWPYGPARGVPLPDRVGRALSRIPEPLQPYALAVFANVAYLPDPLLRTAWSFLGKEIARALDAPYPGVFDDSLLLEVDPSGLVSDFLHENQVHGRLDTDRFPRATSVNDLASELLLLQHPTTESASSLAAVRLALSKATWLVLSDNVLSGTSLSSDLRRARRLADTFRPLQTTRIVAIAQILTSDAETLLYNTLGDIPIIHAVYFDDRFKVSPENTSCNLFKQSATRLGVLELCKWLGSQEWFCSDARVSATIAKSGDNMAYGFKKGGWTIVTPNCPTNSLPILWYENAQYYEAPFPRIMSRTSQARGYGGEVVDAAVAAATIIKERLGVGAT